MTVLFGGLYLCTVLLKSVWSIRQAYQRIDDARANLMFVQAKNEELKRKVAEVQTKDYLERVARNDLNMQKDGETIVVLTDNDPVSVKRYDETKEEKERPNYLKWWELVR